MSHYVIPNSGLKRDDEGSKLGMWLFLYTEILLFGGLFLVYAIYRMQYFDAFREISLTMDVTFGTINTIVLITSSLTVAASITAVRKGHDNLAVFLLILTILAAITFMINKYFEWSHHIHMGLFPGMEEFSQLPRGEGMFLNLYYFMTGLHGLHVVIGAILLGFVIRSIMLQKSNPDRYVFVENGGLYWHLVDLVWIYLFPLFYLVH
jgi:cytochrome c oxidase subunit 3